MSLQNITIRSARIQDAPEVASVHINAWRQAYRNLIPASYLDALPESFPSRIKFWGRYIRDVRGRSLIVAESAGQIVGFLSADPAQDLKFDKVKQDDYDGTKLNEFFLPLGENLSPGVFSCRQSRFLSQRLKI